MNIRKKHIKFVELEMTEQQGYMPFSSNDRVLDMFADFLITIIKLSKKNVDFFCDWIDGVYLINGKELTGIDEFSFWNENGEILIYCWCFFDDEKMNDANVFRIEKEKLKTIIRKWIEVVGNEDRPKKILLVQDEQGDVDIIPQ